MGGWPTSEALKKPGDPPDRSFKINTKSKIKARKSNSIQPTALARTNDYFESLLKIQIKIKYKNIKFFLRMFPSVLWWPEHEADLNLVGELRGHKSGN